MNLDDFQFSAAFSFLAVLAAFFGGAAPGAGALFFASLFAACGVGYLFLSELQKSGTSGKKAAYLYAASCLLSFFAAMLFSGSLNPLSSFLFLPALLCAPAAACLIKPLLFGA
ncbi:MAG: hypothetical protein N3E51_01800 [Candidatus Micrarchaeota archaeon]|nr:hypothetical protein [Candidatus Micrarchaeota archaeon]